MRLKGSLDSSLLGNRRIAPPLADVMLTWPVHDGDVAGSFFRRLLEAVLQLAGLSG
jgi:hypothetical protein